MGELCKALLYEIVYSYWAVYCGNPTREEYGLYFLRDTKRRK